MAMGKCSAYCSITSDSKAKFAAWLQSWRPPGADQLAPRRPEPEDPLCAGDDIVLCIIFVIFDHGKPLVLKNYKSYKDMFGSAPYSGRSSSIKLSCSKTELSRCTTTAIRYHYYPYTPTKDLLHTIVLHISNRWNLGVTIAYLFNSFLNSSIFCFFYLIVVLEEREWEKAIKFGLNRTLAPEQEKPQQTARDGCNIWQKFTQSTKF